MSENVRKRSKYKVHIRRKKVLEYRAQGMTQREIADKIGVSERTVLRDIASQEFQEFIDEIVRQQLADIITGDLKIRLQYRDKILDKIIPKQFQTKTEATHKIVWEAWKPDSNSEE